MNWVKGHWQLIALTLIVAFLWSWPVMVPLKILVVFFHEISHGIAAVVTGGEIVSISISADQGGEAWTRGGSRFVTLSAGYLGSLLIGIVLLLCALNSKADRALMGVLAAVMLAVAALYIREGFALAFCVVLGVAMLAAAWFLPGDINDLALRVIGLTSIIYVPRDIFSDTIERSFLQSDAYMLGEEFFGTAQFWGGLWILLSIAAIAVCLRYGLGRESNITFRR